MYFKNADQIIEEYGVKDFVESYISKFIYGITFLPVEKLNAFMFLYLSLACFGKIYDFKFLQNKITSGFEDKVIVASVHKIKKAKGHYIASTSSKDYLAKNVVIATPPHISKKLLNLKQINQAAFVNMFHVSGQMKPTFQDYKYNLFSSDIEITGISAELDSTFLVYSKNNSPDFEKYFEKYSIIHHHYWNPAFNLIGHTLLDSKQDENLYLIGDNNVCGMEEAFITGLYAANQIIKSVT